MALSWQYIAGFFDGEGNINVPMGARGATLNMQICQAGPEGMTVLTEIMEFLETHGIKSRIDGTKLVPRRKPVYRLCLGARRGEKFLRMVLPYLHVKRVAAQDVLRYRKIYSGLSTGPLCRAWRIESKRIHKEAMKGSD